MFIDVNLADVDQFSTSEHSTIFAGFENGHKYQGECYMNNNKNYSFYIYFTNDNKEITDYLILNNVTLTSSNQNNKELSFLFQNDQNSEIIFSKVSNNNPAITFRAYS